MKQFVVDAFTDQLFSGNPAAVCILEARLSDDLMQNIARENNLSETAFCVREGQKYHLRWFTPSAEIDLCGHATLATAFVMMNYKEPDLKEIVFSTRSGDLRVQRMGEAYEMLFPAYSLRPVPVTEQMREAFGVMPVQAWMGRDLLCVFEHEEEVRGMNPDLDRLSQLEGLLQHATARGKEYDCVSRSFAPKLNVPEDPVCGSGHCHIVPYWSQFLGKHITAYQASSRGGVLSCRYEGDQVALGGKAVLFSVAELHI